MLFSLSVSAAKGGEDTVVPGHWLSVAAKTDAQGRYALTGLPVGRVSSIQAAASGYLLLSLHDRRSGASLPALDAGDEATFDLSFQRGSRVHGRVVDGADGQGIAAARVRLWLKQGSMGTGAETPDG